MNRYLSAAALALAFGLLAGCSGDGPAAGEGALPKMEVRVYTVPPEQTEMLGRTLNEVLATGGKSGLGKVSSPAPGQLVVLAPANLQGSVEASLRTLTAGGPAPAATATATKPGEQLRLSFWSVDAVPENGPDDPALASLQPALDEARKQLGIVHFELRDHVSGVSGPGQQVRRTWVGTGVANAALNRDLSYTLRENATSLSLELTYTEEVARVEMQGGQPLIRSLPTATNTTTAVRLGQTLVITQNPVTESDGTNSIVTMRLHLVRVDAVPEQ